MTKRYFCKKCNAVFEGQPKCCGDVEEFSFEKHGETLLYLSNSWVQVWERWKDNPILKEIFDELCNDGCYGAATHINAFIEKLIEMADKEE